MIAIWYAAGMVKLRQNWYTVELFLPMLPFVSWIDHRSKHLQCKLISRSRYRRSGYICPRQLHRSLLVQ
ncbi:MAG: hypothetical protein D6747_01915 [Chlorobiota bacterium]|nr:MAG: hypothetical protein D6747_01915 [Chlorobiota bacterium]